MMLRLAIAALFAAQATAQRDVSEIKALGQSLGGAASGTFSDPGQPQPKAVAKNTARYANEIAAAVAAAKARFGVDIDPVYVRALIDINNNRKNPMMVYNPAKVDLHFDGNLKECADNITCGTLYLGMHLKKRKEMRKALIGYRFGAGSAEKSSDEIETFLRRVDDQVERLRHPAEHEVGVVRFPDDDGAIAQAPAGYQRQWEAYPYRALIDKWARAFEVNPDLLECLLWMESPNGKADVKKVSPAGALGIAQLMPETAAWLGVEDPFNEEQAIWGLAKYTRFLLNQKYIKGNYRLAIAAYNCGQGNVKQCGGVPDNPETTSYVERALNVYEAITGRKVKRG
jgi:hypothetical protein